MDFTEQVIRRLLAEITLNPEFHSSPAGEELQKLGLDSIGMIHLVYSLEEKFQIRIEDSEVLPQNFRTIQTLAQFVRGKYASL